MAYVSPTQATTGQRKQVLRLIDEAGADALERLGLTRLELQRLFRRGGEFKQELGKVLTPLFERFSTAPNIIVVPDLSAVDLTALVKRKLNLTYIDADYERWDYYTDLKGQPIAARGQKFEVMVWTPELKPDETISSEAVRRHFRDLGYEGHAGAFTQWRRTCGLQGYHASIPEDNACWLLSSGGLYAPCSIFDGGNRKLSLSWFDGDWFDHWSFVAFREILL